MTTKQARAALDGILKRYQISNPKDERPAPGKVVPIKLSEQDARNRDIALA
jgi:hypothetical protein